MEQTQSKVLPSCSCRKRTQAHVGLSEKGLQEDEVATGSEVAHKPDLIYHNPVLF